MSAKELEIITAHGYKIKISKDKNEFEFEVDYDDTIWFWLDHSQAHLLMLYLQEHLKK